MLFGSQERACTSCRDLYPASDLDRYLWCPSCQDRAGRRAAILARSIGAAAALGVALYVALVINPSQPYLLLYGLAIIVTYVLGNRIVRAVVHGFYRSKGSAPDPLSSAGDP